MLIRKATMDDIELLTELISLEHRCFHKIQMA